MSRATEYLIKPMVHIAAIGECMLEISELSDGKHHASHGGDTFNTAAYLARLLSNDQYRVSYITALGDDPFSNTLLQSWQAENIETGCVQRRAGRLPGLYWIKNTPDGEREFFYWRGEAAVRYLFDEPFELPSLDWLYISGITLAIFQDEPTGCLWTMLENLKSRGTKIAMDPNYRERLWPDPEKAKDQLSRLSGLSDIALPTFEDEQQLYGDENACVTAARLEQAGVEEMVIKRGAAPCLARIGKEQFEIAPAPGIRPVDTTGAGDSFNAAYLASRIMGISPQAAIANAHRLAGTVVTHRGAIIDRTFMPELSL